MKLDRLTITTNYPQGYSREDPRLITGEICLAFDGTGYGSAEHKLSSEAMERIINIAIHDFLNYETPEASSVFLRKEDLPPIPPLPEAAPLPEAPATEDERPF